MSAIPVWTAYIITPSGALWPFGLLSTVSLAPLNTFLFTYVACRTGTLLP